MMNRKPALLVTLLTLLAMILPSCSDSNDGPATEEITSYDIVCLSEFDSKKGSTFTMTKPSGNRLITYSSSQLIDTTIVHLGDRLILAYRTANQEPYKSGHITAVGYSPINNDRLRRPGSSTTVAESEPVYLMSGWMSQDFLNLRLKLPYTQVKRQLYVAVQENTISDEYPVCNLVHHLDEPVNTFDRETYLSVDMSALRTLPHCKGFILKVNNSNLKIDSFTFNLLDYNNL